MTVAGFDHVAIPSERPEELIGFYRRLGFGIEGEGEWRAGRTAAFAITFGDNKINVHTPALWQDPAFTLRAPAARPGCGDFCFVWRGSMEALAAHLQAAGARVEVGPVQRRGGRSAGKATGTSLYTRDPEGNLLEFIVYG